nr:MAG TPA: hypothetical protein [Caudoviricetes sp.]
MGRLKPARTRKADAKAPPVQARPPRKGWALMG